MSKSILLIGGNYFPELTGIGKYNGEMMKWFAQQGLNSTILTTYPYYPQWKIEASHNSKAHWFSKEVIAHDDNSETIIRCPHYIPSNPTGSKRLLSDVSIFFSLSLALIPQLFKKKHDYVICVAPPFSLGLLGILYKLFRSAKLIYHMQDLQVDAARELNMINSKLVIDLLFKVEKFILKRTDVNSTISEGMMSKVQAKLSRSITYFPNWVNVDSFYPVINKEQLKPKFGFSCTDKIILYSGAIGEKQGLEMIVDCAEYFKDNNSIKFLICGLGPFKEKLVNNVKNKELQNVHFLPLQSSDNFNEFLNMADVHLVLQKANASDLVLPSKLLTILSTGGLAIVTANPNTSLYKMMNDFDMGILVQPEDQSAFNEAVTSALINNTHNKSVNARRYAEENLSVQSVLSNFCENVLQHEFKFEDEGKKVTTLSLHSAFKGEMI